MKNYIMIILCTLVASIMINTANNVKADISTEVIANTDSSEVTSLTSLDTYNEAENTEIATTAKTTVKNTVKSTASTSVSNGFNYNITKNISVSEINTNKNPGANIIRANKLVYAHNSSDLLGSIKNLGVNSTFTLTENGVTKTYKVVDTAIFIKSNAYDLNLCTSGYDNCNGGTYRMANLANGSKFRGKTYSVALFTCDGTSLGNGDATHRRVVFAVEA